MTVPRMPPFFTFGPSRVALGRQHASHTPLVTRMSNKIRTVQSKRTQRKATKAGYDKEGLLRCDR